MNAIHDTARTSPWPQSLKRFSMVLGFCGALLCALQAQTHHDCGLSFSVEQSRYDIAYGEPLDVKLVNETGSSASWTVSPAPSQGNASGKGNATGKLVFREPGTYTVTFRTSDSHGEHSAATQVVVNAVNLKFLTEQATLSQKIKVGVSTEGITLTVPVEVASHKKEPVRFGPFTAVTSGACKLSVTLAEEVELKQGTNLVTFRLSGTATQTGNAQVGFFNAWGGGFFYNFLITE